ncbi:MAG: hypothetical protein KA498_05360 [Neisseriaceae bacterium]|nr:hypothetical protein [Neisseriaceae bacterium]
MRRIVKVEKIDSVIFAFCDDNSLWYLESSWHNWKRAPNIPQDETRKHLDQMPILKLGISNRSYKALSSANIFTIGDLVRKSKSELLILPALGKKSIHEIEIALGEMDLYLH